MQLQLYIAQITFALPTATAKLIVATASASSTAVATAIEISMDALFSFNLRSC